MTSRSLILVGGPDSGKSNYLARLWAALSGRKGSLFVPNNFGNVKYIEDSLAHLLQGQFVPRSDQNLESTEQGLKIPFLSSSEPDSEADFIVVPDVSGELWKKAVSTCELSEEWMASMAQADGALLFVRIASDQNVAPLDWVTAADLLSMPFMNPVGDQDGESEGQEAERQIPTQVALCELIRFMESKMVTSGRSQVPRLAVLVTAWDRLDPVRAAKGPKAFLEAEYPLFAGRLHDTALEVQTFGVSVVGGDFIEEEFKNTFFDGTLDDAGWIVTDGPNGPQTVTDLTRPVAWALRRL